MHVIQYFSRIYSLIFLCLCAAVLFAPKVNAAVYTIDDAWHEFNTLKREVDDAYRRMTNRPSNTTLVSTNSPLNISKNTSGGLSASTNQILKTLDQPSTFTSTNNYSVASAKTALKSCVRSPACAARALGTGAIIYEGIKGWQNVYELTLGDDGRIYQLGDIYVPVYPPEKYTSFYRQIGVSGRNVPAPCPSKYNGSIVVSCGAPINYPDERWIYTCSPTSTNGRKLVGFIPNDWCEYDFVPEPITNRQPEPVTLQDVESYIDEGYSPAVSDAPIVLLSGEPETISLSTPASAELPATTTTNTDSQGKTTTTVKNSVITYNILNNNSPSPSIESTITETSNTYDDTANLVGSMTSTTTNNAVAPDPLPPSSPSAPLELDFELPAFCSWASIGCDWIGWTKEPLDELEPDLTDLITVFEPDEDEFDLGIGLGTCPAPMMLNLAIINKTVEVKYDPFCSFLEMIRPFVLAAAYLFAAYMYLGVLRRG